MSDKTNQGRIRAPGQAAVDCRQAMLEAMRPFQATVPPQEMLAMLSHTVGQVLAMQDQRYMTREMGLELIGRNIELGNQAAVAALIASKGNG